MRRLLRSPALTAAAVVTLALGVAANATIFSVVEATLLRPLPYPHADRLVALEVQLRRDAETLAVPWSWADFSEFARQASFEDAAVYSDATLTLGAAGQVERVPIEIVSAPYFQLLGVQPVLGGLFGGGNEPGVVISHALWLHRFGGAPDVVGRGLVADGKHALVVAGVAPAGFKGLTGNAELWVPVHLAPLLIWPGALDPRNSWLSAVARVPAGKSIAAAREAASKSFAAVVLARPRSSNEKFAVRVTPLQESRTDPGLRRAALVLLGAVAFLLLVAAANLSSLLLARAAARQRDVAILSALGASRLQVLGDFLAEALLLAVAGGTLGVLLAGWGLDALLTLRPSLTGDAAFWRDLTPSSVQLDLKVVLLAGLLALGACAISSLPAALLAGRRSLVEALHESSGASRTAPVRVLSGRGALVILQLAISLVLVLGAALLLRSYAAVRAVPPGFQPKGLVAVRLHQSAAQTPEARTAFTARLLSEARGLPGVQAVSVDRALPLTGSYDTTEVGEIEGQPPFADGAAPGVALEFVGPDHLTALQARLLDGRFFTTADRLGTASVVVLSETAARRLFPQGHAVGHRIDAGGEKGKPNFAEVVGVIADIVYELPHMPVMPRIFRPALQDGFPGTWLILRAQPGLDAGTVAASAQKLVATLDPGLAVSAPRLLETVAAEATSQQRFAAVLLAVFAAVALLLSGSGVYGLLSFSIEQRQREIGIRLALGATRGHVLRLIAADSLRLVVLGILLGGAMALAALRLLSSLLYGVTAGDPLVALASGLVLLLIAAAATLLPLWRGLAVDPAAAMRAD